MTKQIFENILEENNITWNDIVCLIIYNPEYNPRSWWSSSKKLKTITFTGALGYHKSDDNVSIMVDNKDIGINDNKCTDLHFTFEQIVGIKKL